jgi:hypothetical protein
MADNIIRLPGIAATITVVDAAGGQANIAGVTADLSAAQRASSTFNSIMADLSSRYSNVNVIFTNNSLSQERPFFSRQDADGTSWDLFVATNSSASISNGLIGTGSPFRDATFLDGAVHELAHAIAPNEIAGNRTVGAMAGDESWVRNRATTIQRELEEGGVVDTHGIYDNTRAYDAISNEFGTPFATGGVINAQSGVRSAPAGAASGPVHDFDEFTPESDLRIHDVNGNLVSEQINTAQANGDSSTTFLDGTGHELGTEQRYTDSTGNVVSESGTNASGVTWSENLNGDNSTFTYNGQTFGGPQFTSSAGLTLGSTIGGILGGNSIAGGIVGSTVIGALGQSVGTALVANGLGVPLLGGGSLNASLFDDAVSSTVANFGGDLGVNAVGNIAGGFSSLLFGEAAHALGLNGFAGGLFTTIGTSITSQLATNLGAMTLNAAGISTTLATNFSAGAFIGNISGAIGGYFGSYLANEIVPATGIASSIGGRIGGAIGGFLASEIPVVGTFFGSLAGSVLGTLIGGLFDPHILPWSQEMVGAVNGVLGINYWNWNGGGNPQEFTSLSNMVAGNANQVLALTRRDPNIMNVTGLTSLNELVFNQLGSTLTAIYPDGNSTNFYVDGMPQWFALQALYNTSEIATYELVQHATLVGSDPIVTGALAAARVQDTTTPAVYADLRVAQDYERYRANAEIINTAMAANPDSDFTAGWNVTLMRARGLGLDRIVNYPGWTADLTDNRETIHDAAGNIVQQLTFNADGSVTTDTGTLVFNFNFVGTRLSYGLNGHTYLTGPDGAAHDITGATRLFFNDGRIDEGDGSPLVDDLWYDNQYNDVYLAGADPDAHYAGGGWREGRNPNPYFNTNYYLSRNADVAAAGVDPLQHYDINGWHEGRDPSARFSTNGYLRAYGDVAAANIDPLAHFLTSGMIEGRIARAQANIHDDFNGDGIADILMHNAGTGDVGFVRINNGEAVWHGFRNATLGYTAVGTADFNGDGISDVLWCDYSSGDTGYWTINSAGNVAGWQDLGSASTNYRVAGIGDFNGDGTPDILWHDATSGATGYNLISNGGTTSTWHQLRNATIGYSVVGIGDFNRDGTSDIFWENGSTGDTGYWALVDGGNSVAWHQLRTAVLAYSAAGVADFNGDGTPDILWRDNTGGDTGYWAVVDGGNAVAWHGFGGTNTGYRVAAVGDYNGDGTPDVLWHNGSTGDTGYWQITDNGNSTTWQGLGLIGTPFAVAIQNV